jgi:hypothetical protein
MGMSVEQAFDAAKNHKMGQIGYNASKLSRADWINYFTQNVPGWTKLPSSKTSWIPGNNL